MPSSHQQKLFPLVYGENFFTDYAGRLIADPKIALIELVANCWDAQAENVHIIWPEHQNGNFEISDDGEGMTREEFTTRWNTLNYNRKASQKGSNQSSSNKKTRPIYGRNGKGRHSLFCFSDLYTVETWKNGKESTYKIELLKSQKDPYEVNQIKETQKEGHGTKISTVIKNNYIPTEDVIRILGSKFVVDPSFEIFVNNEKIEREDLLNNATYHPYHIDGEGDVKIYIIDSQMAGRISGHHGVAFWVNNRLVGEHSWKNFENTYLDGRTQAAKRYSIIVEANILEDEVLVDWTWFKDTPRVNKIIESIRLFILDTLHQLMKDVRTEAKRAVLQKNRDNLRDLGDFGKVQIGSAIEKIQMSCPAINQRDLANIIDIVINLEMTSSGYKLLQQLADTSPDDMDSLSTILDEWTIIEAKIVLDLLGGRVKLINEIERRTQDPTIDELHEIQPLFEEGLWIFGPEYEGVKYLGNKQINTIIKQFFKQKTHIQSTRRPDIVALPNSVIESFSCDNFEDGEPFGILKIFILELKKGGIDITTDVRRQAEDYAELIRNSGTCDGAEILCYVLGSAVRCGSHIDKNEKIEVIPLSYLTVLRKAKLRTFNLINKIKESKKILPEIDPDVQNVLNEPIQSALELEEF